MYTVAMQYNTCYRNIIININMSYCNEVPVQATSVASM